MYFLFLIHHAQCFHNNVKCLDTFPIAFYSLSTEKSSSNVKKEGITSRDNGLCNVPDAFTIQVKFLLGASKFATEIRNTFEKSSYLCSHKLTPFRIIPGQTSELSLPK